jgi:Ser/Thr protein kinase RdoA (MazF antagonist)
MVRPCHGDLHLRNIVSLNGQPTLFDAIEFNDEISSIDVLYDLAFLLMDLWRLDLPHHANVLWNAYLAETDDLDGVSLMPLFMSCRAAVLAKTTATAANLRADADRRVELRALANDYLTLANRLLEAPESVLTSRVASREPDVSDAGVDVVRRQLAYRPDSLRWHRLDTSGTRCQACDAAAAVVADQNKPVAASAGP